MRISLTHCDLPFVIDLLCTLSVCGHLFVFWFGSSSQVSALCTIKVRMGLGTAGQNKVELEVEGGKVDLDPLTGGGSPASVDLRRVLAGGGQQVVGRMGLITFLVACMPRKGSGMSWLLAQVLHFLGLALEEGLRAMPSMATPGTVQTAGTRRKADRDVAVQMDTEGRFLTGYRRLARVTLAKYWMAGYRWFHDSWARCVAVDASRVGGKDLLQGVLLSWKGDAYRAMVCPPMVPLSPATDANEPCQELAAMGPHDFARFPRFLGQVFRTMQFHGGVFRTMDPFLPTVTQKWGTPVPHDFARFRFCPESFSHDAISRGQN